MSTTDTFKKTLAAISAGIVLLAAVPLAQAFDHPGGLHTQSQLDRTRQQILAGKQPWVAAWEQLLNKAKEGLSESPSAVRYYEVPRYYADPSGHGKAKAVLLNDARAAYATAVAYAVGADLSPSERSRYADKAVELLNDWAYTNTSFADSGDARLVLSYTGGAFAWAAELVWDYEGWNSADKAQFQRWAGDILGAAGAMIMDSTNNWGDWGVLAVLSAARITGDEKAFDAGVERLKELIDDQISKTGRMWGETSRDERGFHYTDFALESMTAGIEIIRNSGGPNLYNWQPPSGGTVRDALDFLFDYGIENPDLWPGGDQLIKPSPSGKAADTMQAMGLVYGVQKWLDWVDPPIYRDGTGLAFIAPTLLQPLPKDAVDAPLAPSTPTGVTLQVVR